MTESEFMLRDAVNPLRCSVPASDKPRVTVELRSP
jgi:hypothetical protein